MDFCVSVYECYIFAILSYSGMYPQGGLEREKVSFNLNTLRNYLQVTVCFSLNKLKLINYTGMFQYFIYDATKNVSTNL